MVGCGGERERDLRPRSIALRKLMVVAPSSLFCIDIQILHLESFGCNEPLCVYVCVCVFLLQY